MFPLVGAQAAPLIFVCTQTPEAIFRPKEIGAYGLARCEKSGAMVAAGLAYDIF
jgi:hypothetical protein